MDMKASEYGSDLVITVEEDRVDAAVAVQFKDQIREIAGAHPSRRVILDLKQVGFMDSSGLGAVIGTMKQLGNNRPLALASLSPSVEKVFRVTRMDQLLTIYDDANAALLDVAYAS